MTVPEPTSDSPRALRRAVFQRRMVREIETDQLTLTTQGRLVAWAVALHEADLAEEVVRLARSGDLKEAIAQGSRASLLEQLEPPLNRLRKSPLAMSQLTLYAPDGRLLVHAHDPDDAHGPVFEQRRLLGAALGERRIVKGLEIIGGVPHVLAVSPVYHDGKLIGVLQAGTSLAPILRSLQAVAGARLAVRLTDGQVVATASPELFNDVLRRVAPAAEASRHVVQSDQRALVVTLVPWRRSPATRSRTTR